MHGECSSSIAAELLWHQQMQEAVWALHREAAAPILRGSLHTNGSPRI